MISIIEFTVIIMCLFTAYIGGWFFTETKYYLSKYPCFRFKMFECKKCLTFHIGWILVAYASLIFNSWWVFGLGLLLDCGLFYLLYKDEKERFI